MKFSKAKLILRDGNTFEGQIFGSRRSVSGEVVFNTGMVGYPETLTDPSYRGQILVLTYPLIGNYGVPSFDQKLVTENFESSKIQVSALIVSEFSKEFDHWKSIESLDNWLKKNNVPGLFSVDTRLLTKIIREKGTILGKIIVDNESVDFYDPDTAYLISEVTIPKVEKYGTGRKRILLIDCGCKNSIIKNVLKRGFTIFRVPYHYDIEKEDYDGVIISNGPGNPIVYDHLVNTTKLLMKKKVPILGICLGHQILSIAAGAKTFKLKYGHRSQNQPVKETWSNKCYITSQNHSFAVASESLPSGWKVWFENLNDYSNEGVIHEKLPFMGVQFHPEASPGPTDTTFIFDEFLRLI